MNKEDRELEVIFNHITDKLKKFSEENFDEFINDVDKLYYIIGTNDTTFIEADYWEYFKAKYDIPSIEKYFDNTDEMLSILYYNCLSPFNDDMKRLYKEEKPQDLKLVSYLNKFKNLVIILFTTALSSTILFILTALAIYVSYYFHNQNEVWITNISIGFATSLFAAYIITLINRYLEWRSYKYSSSANNTKRTTKEFLFEYDELYKKINQYSEDKNKLLLFALDLQSEIKRYIKAVDDYSNIKSLNGFYILVEFEEEFSELLLNMVNGIYFKEYQKPDEAHYKRLKLLMFDFLVVRSNYEKEVDKLLEELYNSINFFRKKRV